ncbi:hypothetical protein [Rubrolithibacter danxiaensis]|uniref:hypothetical protein n=1 Tax=Rubrolithibacter danxiaensis TaxID=3390805 RepID=UPI003BF7B47E
MVFLTISERLQIYTRYIGQKVILIHKYFGYREVMGILTGINSQEIQVSIDNQDYWIRIYDAGPEIKLFLKPLSRLTEDVKQIANNLPIQNFITQYYIRLGFDMPVFIAPGHPANCKYVEELGLATYNEPEVILQSLQQNNASGFYSF